MDPAETELRREPQVDPDVSSEAPAEAAENSDPLQDARDEALQDPNQVLSNQFTTNYENGLNQLKAGVAATNGDKPDWELAETQVGKSFKSYTDAAKAARKLLYEMDGNDIKTVDGKFVKTKAGLELEKKFNELQQDKERAPEAKKVQDLLNGYTKALYGMALSQFVKARMLEGDEGRKGDRENALLTALAFKEQADESLGLRGLQKGPNNEKPFESYKDNIAEAVELRKTKQDVPTDNPGEPAEPAKPSEPSEPVPAEKPNQPAKPGKTKPSDVAAEQNDGLLPPVTIGTDKLPQGLTLSPDGRSISFQAPGQDTAVRLPQGAKVPEEAVIIINGQPLTINGEVQKELVFKDDPLIALDTALEAAANDPKFTQATHDLFNRAIQFADSIDKVSAMSEIQALNAQLADVMKKNPKLGETLTQIKENMKGLQQSYGAMGEQAGKVTDDKQLNILSTLQRSIKTEAQLDQFLNSDNANNVALKEFLTDKDRPELNEWLTQFRKALSYGDKITGLRADVKNNFPEYFQAVGAGNMMSGWFYSPIETRLSYLGAMNQHNFNDQTQIAQGQKLTAELAQMDPNVVKDKRYVAAAAHLRGEAPAQPVEPTRPAEPAKPAKTVARPKPEAEIPATDQPADTPAATPVEKPAKPAIKPADKPDDKPRERVEGTDAVDPKKVAGPLTKEQYNCVVDARRAFIEAQKVFAKESADNPDGRVRPMILPDEIQQKLVSAWQASTTLTPENIQAQINEHVKFLRSEQTVEGKKYPGWPGDAVVARDKDNNPILDDNGQPIPFEVHEVDRLLGELQKQIVTNDKGEALFLGDKNGEPILDANGNEIPLANDLQKAMLIQSMVPLQAELAAKTKANAPKEVIEQLENQIAINRALIGGTKSIDELRKGNETLDEYFSALDHQKLFLKSPAGQKYALYQQQMNHIDLLRDAQSITSGYAALAEGAARNPAYADLMRNHVLDALRTKGVAEFLQRQTGVDLNLYAQALNIQPGLITAIQTLGDKSVPEEKRLENAKLEYEKVFAEVKDIDSLAIEKIKGEIYQLRKGEHAKYGGLTDEEFDNTDEAKKLYARLEEAAPGVAYKKAVTAELLNYATALQNYGVDHDNKEMRDQALSWFQRMMENDPSLAIRPVFRGAYELASADTPQRIDATSAIDKGTNVVRAEFVESGNTAIAKRPSVSSFLADSEASGDYARALALQEKKAKEQILASITENRKEAAGIIGNIGSILTSEGVWQGLRNPKVVAAMEDGVRKVLPKAGGKLAVPITVGIDITAAVGAGFAVNEGTKYSSHLAFDTDLDPATKTLTESMIAFTAGRVIGAGLDYSKKRLAAQLSEEILLEGGAKTTRLDQFMKTYGMSNEEAGITANMNAEQKVEALASAFRKRNVEFKKIEAENKKELATVKKESGEGSEAYKKAEANGLARQNEFYAKYGERQLNDGKVAGTRAFFSPSTWFKAPETLAGKANPLNWSPKILDNPSSVNQMEWRLTGQAVPFRVGSGALGTAILGLNEKDDNEDFLSSENLSEMLHDAEMGAVVSLTLPVGVKMTKGIGSAVVHPGETVKGVVALGAFHHNPVTGLGAMVLTNLGRVIGRRAAERAAIAGAPEAIAIATPAVEANAGRISRALQASRNLFGQGIDRAADATNWTKNIASSTSRRVGQTYTSFEGSIPGLTATRREIPELTYGLGYLLHKDIAEIAEPVAQQRALEEAEERLKRHNQAQ